MSGSALSDGNDQAFTHPELRELIRQYGGRHAERALALAAAWRLAGPHARRLAKKLAKRDEFTITVPGTDDIYGDLHEWVLRRLPDGDRKALIASTVAARELRHDGEEPAPLTLGLRYDGDRVHTITVAGHSVTVMVQREPMPDRANLPENWRQLTERIVFTARNADGRDAIISMLEQLLIEKHARKGPPPLLIPSRWGGSWNFRADLPPRPLHSVILKAGQLERLVEDLEHFLAAEAEYANLSQPWHRGYLFHGEPGTGKTSIARALAGHFGMPTYYLPLADLEHDADLMNLVGMIRPRSALLVEDVDVYHAATERDDENGRSSIAAMLNALDGWVVRRRLTVARRRLPGRTMNGQQLLWSQRRMLNKLAFEPQSVAVLAGHAMPYASALRTLEQLRGLGLAERYESRLGGWVITDAGVIAMARVWCDLTRPRHTTDEPDRRRRHRCHCRAARP